MVTLSQKEFARQEINRINSKPVKKQHDQQLLEHYQRILNTNFLSKEEIKKSEQGKLTVEYKGEQDFADWEATIDKSKVTRLEIKGGSQFEENKLVIKDYPNLSELYALNCNLEKVEIDAPWLEILNLIGNLLIELDVNNLPLLETLSFSENKILKVIVGLEKLTNLKELTCFKCSLEELDCSNNRQLKQVFVANQFSVEFRPNFQGCDNLEVLDVAENRISELDCFGLTKLKDISIKENFGFLRNGQLFKKIEQKLNSLSSSSCDDSNIFFDENGLISQFTGFRSLNTQNIILWIKRIFANNSEKLSLEHIKKAFKSIINISFENCTSLERLNFSKSLIGNLNVNNCPSLKGVTCGWLIERDDLDETGQEQYMLSAEPVEGGCLVEKIDDSDCELDAIEEEFDQKEGSSENQKKKTSSLILRN